MKTMKIGFVFYGITYGPGGRTGSDRDFRHCWPNIVEMLLDPFWDLGFEREIYFSTYPFTDKGIEKEFYDLVKPRKVVFSEMEGSDPFTTKGNCFGAFENDADLDLVCISRSDVHYSRKIADSITVDCLDKFNFLFPEGDGWWQRAHFTCDNFYLFPFKMTPVVKEAIHDTYAWPRGKPLVDTHALMDKLAEYMPTNRMNILSKTEEISDVNSFYTCCRSGLPEDGRGGHIHPEVKERFNYSDESCNRSRGK